MSDLLALTLFALLPGLAVVGSSRGQRRTYPPEQQIATLYLRAGRLRLRRRKGVPHE